MPSSAPRPSLPEGDGFFNSLYLRLRLIVRLLADGRVNPFLKILPAFSLLYALVLDILPGPLDDGMLLWLGGYLFVELCPRGVVDEHWQKLTGQPYRTAVPRGPSARSDDEDVIDAEFRDLD